MIEIQYDERTCLEIIKIKVKLFLVFNFVRAVFLFDNLWNISIAPVQDNMSPLPVLIG